MANAGIHFFLAYRAGSVMKLITCTIPPNQIQAERIKLHLLTCTLEPFRPRATPLEIAVIRGRHEPHRSGVRKLNLSNIEKEDLKIQHFCGFSASFLERISNPGFPALATTMIVMPLHDYSRIAQSAH
jgi:hypothetical protein